MKFSFGPAVRWLLPGTTYLRKTTLIFFTAIFLKLILFDVVWCLNTTFTAFSLVELWLYTTLAALVCVIPYVVTRSWIVMAVVMVALDMLLVSNLLYFRTYNSSIPLYSYGLAGNLEDFKESVYASIRWVDAVFFVITGVALWMALRLKRKYRQAPECVGPDEDNSEAVGGKQSGRWATLARYLILPLTVFAVCFGILLSKGGFMNAYRSLHGANRFSCGTPMYTIFGTMYYDLLKGRTVYTPETGEEIENWLAMQEAGRTVTPLDGNSNFIVILAESFESWVVGLTFEGKEITPNLNRLLAGDSVFYAPRIQSQVKGGRSIDGQLLLNTGLLPIETGTYSMQYAVNEYPSLLKAVREKYPAVRSTVMTVDKHIVWNQGMVAKAFGFDRLLDRASFVAEEKIGPRRKNGDGSFLRQCAEKILSGEVWDRSGNNYVQIVTYSGHSPFKLPDDLALVSFDTDMPAMMRDYMTMANYTDNAIGRFLEMLREEGILENTTVVITGDHEGLADNRDGMTRSAAGRGVVSPDQFTPLIVFNSPVNMVYEPVMGQVDMFPTLIELFGLDGYWWKGLGMSALDPGRVPVAFTPQMKMVGTPDGATAPELDHIKSAWRISDLIITHDYFGRESNQFQATPNI